MKFPFAQYHHKSWHCEGLSHRWSPEISTWTFRWQMAMTPSMQSSISACGLSSSTSRKLRCGVLPCGMNHIPIVSRTSRIEPVLLFNVSKSESVFCPSQLEMVRDDGQLQKLQILLLTCHLGRCHPYIISVRNDCSKPHTRPLGLHCSTTH